MLFAADLDFFLGIIRIISHNMGNIFIISIENFDFRINARCLQKCVPTRFDGRYIFIWQSAASTSALVIECFDFYDWQGIQ